MARATIIYDPIAGPLASNLVGMASPEARYICYGDLNPANTNFSENECVCHHLKDNIFKPIIDTVFYGLISTADAHWRMESNAQFSKIVVNL
jgi:hypothetical protein